MSPIQLSNNRNSMFVSHYFCKANYSKDTFASLQASLTDGLGNYFIFLFFCLSVFLGPHPQHAEVPRPIRAAAPRLHHSHSHARSQPRPRPTPQLTAMPDRQPTKRGQRSNPQPHGSQSDSSTTGP